MPTMKISVKTLGEFGACPRGTASFARQFPNGITLTDDQVVNFERLSDSYIQESVYEPYVPVDITDLCWLAVVIGGSSDIIYRDWNNDMAGRSRLFFVAGLLADAIGCRAAKRRPGVVVKPLNFQELVDDARVIARAQYARERGAGGK